ncbi:hypothetical protein QTV49_004776 [Vibrio vulnificus]|nr:hypothetical protein [Vibrio vulnificus]
MNKIQKKVSLLSIEKILFVHPSLDSREILEEKCKLTLYSFVIEGVEYLIADPYSTMRIAGSERGHKIFVQLSENQWGETSIYLYGWEFDFLVSGYDVVNSHNYHADKAKFSGVSRYLTDKELGRELDIWRKRDESGESNNMVDFIKSVFTPVTLDADGEWQPK